MTPQLKGLLFERKIHDLLLMTQFNVLSEKEVIKKYGSNICAIDHMIEFGDFILCIQDKHQQTSASISQINHFICCVNNVSFITKLRCVGLYITINGLSKPSLDTFKLENSKNNNFFHEINGKNEEDVIFNLAYYLHENSVYLYDESGLAIMLDTENKKIII